MSGDAALRLRDALSPRRQHLCLPLKLHFGGKGSLHAHLMSFVMLWRGHDHRLSWRRLRDPSPCHIRDQRCEHGR